MVFCSPGTFCNRCSEYKFMIFAKIISSHHAPEAHWRLAGGVATGTRACDLPAPRQGAGGLGYSIPAALPQANFLSASGATAEVVATLTTSAIASARTTA